jgi:hypothetical protein
VIPVSQALGRPTFRCQVKWPDNERCEIKVQTDSPEAAEKYVRDIWGESISVVVTPLVER